MHSCIPNNKRRNRLTTYGEEKVMHPDLVKYEQLLKSHDWTYNYSDDHGVWKKGIAEAEEIRRYKNILNGIGMSEIAEKMYTKYSPFES